MPVDLVMIMTIGRCKGVAMVVHKMTEMVFVRVRSRLTVLHTDAIHADDKMIRSQ